MSFDPRFFYDDYPRIEETFGALADTSLSPRGPEMLLQVVRELDLAPVHLIFRASALTENRPDSVRPRPALYRHHHARTKEISSRGVVEAKPSRSMGVFIRGDGGRSRRYCSER